MKCVECGNKGILFTKWYDPKSRFDRAVFCCEDRLCPYFSIAQINLGAKE